MIAKPSDMTPIVDMTLRQRYRPDTVLSARSIVDLLPPCNNACRAGENIQAWLDLAQAGNYREATTFSHPIVSVCNCPRHEGYGSNCSRS